MDPKIIAMYLPQYHCIPENDKWWGKGFTDWDAVKSAVPLFHNHLQPKVPYNNNYYKLDEFETIKWQAHLAKSNGIYGFGIYHYWFNSDLKLLTKPAELLLEHSEIEINYFFAWDNSTWIRTWSNLLRKEKYINDWSPKHDLTESIDNDNNGVLAELKYGDENDWEIHFNYLLPFFKDDRYIKIDNCPIFTIWNNKEPDTLIKMINYWNKLAVNNGFNGIKFISRYDPYNKTDYFDYYFNYEPTFTTNLNRNLFVKIVNRTRRRILKNEKLRIFDYNKVWNKSLKFAAKNKNEKIFYGGFVNYDDTPRRGEKGMVITNTSPSKFEENLNMLYSISKKQKKEFIFLTAWNEWGEGAYLEPDNKFKFEFISGIKKITKGR